MKKATMILGLALLSSTAQADTVFGVYAGAGQWQSGLAGDIGVSGTDFSTLGFSEENNNMFHLAIEHPVPLIPNILLKYTDLTTRGESMLGEDVRFDNINFPSGETLATDIDLRHVDATFYYELLDNWINLDFGVTVRAFEGELMAMSNGLTETVDMAAVVPMGYLKGQFDLPLTGLSFKADANAIAYSGDSLTDMSAAVAWNTDFMIAFDVGVELGYRRMHLDLDDLGDVQTDLTIDGPYLSVNAHF